MKKILQEGLLVALAGATLAFAANAVSPRGLKLTRNYFPASPTPHAKALPQRSSASLSGTNHLSTFEQQAAAFRERGLELVDSNRVVQLFHDPRREQNLVAFIDARRDDHYRQGHIPGAYQFDHFHLENFLPTILPVCQVAEQIVVYCDGGDCELSEHAALFLRDSAGVPKEKLLVYGGGIEEWRSNHLPVETGERNSGQLSAK